MMHNRPHPGEVLAEQLGPEGLGLTVAEAAMRLNLSRPALSRVLHGHAGISTKLALSLEDNGIGTAELWLKMQMRYDLEHARAQAS
ncbi:MAG: HigA family addiction module antitoxin [Leifsonia sp.]|uniref:HigA family addiction module antitoxin n=1 Tax=Leifsonia sp. C5G2 TaxID=2735269 RepID=UPI001584E79C|nr:HigA family addiction module antitoxin [Leifsonia sp. C5G2]NUU07059.1 HigA family addiction module antidote protein [Leifsonia sp. C5G2]